MVSALVYAIHPGSLTDLANRGVDTIDRERINGIALAAVLLGDDVATLPTDTYLYHEVCVLSKIAND